MRQEARERANGAAAALKERTAAAVLALEGVRAAYDASPSVGPTAFSTFARVPLARKEVIAVGWAPRVAASQRTEVEASEQIRISAPANALTTYPLLRLEPAATTADALDLGSDPSLAAALRSRSQPEGRNSPLPSAFRATAGSASSPSSPSSAAASRYALPPNGAKPSRASSPVLSPRTHSSATLSPVFGPTWMSASLTGLPSWRTAPAAPRPLRRRSAAGRGASQLHRRPPRPSPRWASRLRDSP